MANNNITFTFELIIECYWNKQFCLYISVGLQVKDSNHTSQNVPFSPLQDEAVIIHN